MADIRINDLPPENSPTASEVVAIDGANTRKTPIQALVNAGAPIASQAEAQAGIDASKRMTPLTTKQSIASEVGVTLASKAQGDLAAAALPRNEYAFFDTEALFQAANIPNSVNEVRTNGYYAVGDGGGHAKKRIATPSPSKAWHKQSADGAWWEIAEHQVKPQFFGAKADGSYDDTYSIQSSVDFSKNVVFTSSTGWTVTAPILCSSSVFISSNGFVQISQTTAGVPIFISNTNGFSISGEFRLVSTQPKTGSASSGPYRSGIVYHSAVLQVEGNDFSVVGITTYNFTCGIGYHGTQTGSVALGSRAYINRCFFDKYDFGVLARQFDGMDICHLTGRDCEQTVEPGHIIYITDRSVARSRGLRVGSVYDLDNTTAETIKIRNVEGFDVDSTVSENCVRGISIGFSRLGVVRGGTIKMSPSTLGDTQQNGIVVDDCEEISFISPTIDCSDVSNSSGYGIRLRTDIGTFGNRSITFIRPCVIVNWTSTTSNFAPYFTQGNSDVTFINPKFINLGTETPSWPFRIDSGSSNVKIIDPEILNSGNNSTRVVRNRPGTTNTRVSFSRSLSQSYVSSYVLDEAGTCIVERPDKWEILSHNAIGVSLTGTTAETTLATVNIPARSMGGNGKIRITTMWSFTGTGAKTSRIRWNGINLQGIAVTSALNARYLCEIENRNSESSQVAAQGNFLGLGSGGGAALTFSVDTTVDVPIVIQGTLSNSSESITLESYTVEIFRIP